MSLFSNPRRPEFDQYTIKFTVGAIAFSLPWIELVLTNWSITSISDSFWFGVGSSSGLWPGPWARNVFVGLLFAIAAMLFSYNGDSALQMWLGKTAAICAILISMYPCKCQIHEEILVHVHMGAAGVMFAILGVFCIIFWQHANQKKSHEAKRRKFIYAACCLGMVLTLVLFVLHSITKDEVLVLYAETIGLASFGISWLTASRVFPFVAAKHERNQLIV
jgi:hypothetical protein